jgi:hypothetical protein
MLDHIRCPQKAGMAQASERSGLLRTGYLPYLLLRRLKSTFPSSPYCSVPVILLPMLLRRLT